MLFESQRLLRGAPCVTPNERDNLGGKTQWCELVQTPLCRRTETPTSTRMLLANRSSFLRCFWVDWRDCSMCGRTTVCLTGWGQHLGGIKGHSSPLYFFSYLFPLQTWTFPSSEIPHVQGQKRQLNPTARPCACAGHHTALTDPSSLSASRFNYKPVNQCEK